MTVVIPSHQRREQLERLLGVLAVQLAESESLRTGFDAVVVLDGSTDGSCELLRRLTFPVPLTVRAQSHQGLATARNTGLMTATGEIVWFLDDDMVPTTGLIARHRRAHQGCRREVVVGPTPIAPGVSVPDEVRVVYDDLYHALGDDQLIERFDYVTFANASGRTSVFRALGGFDERFAGYGYEDLELAIRLLESGVSIRFDSDAIAWHHSPGVDSDLVRRRSRQLGRNSVKVARAHPSTVDQLFGTRASWRGMRLLGTLRLTSPRSLSAVSEVAAVGARLAGQMVGQRRAGKLRRFASAASYATGVADEDVQRRFLPRLLGGGSTGHRSERC